MAGNRVSAEWLAGVLVELRVALPNVSPNRLRNTLSV